MRETPKNVAYIITTKFVEPLIKNNDCWWGYTFGDMYSKHYMAQFSEESMPTEELHILNHCIVNCNGDEVALFHYINDNEKGISINAKYFNYKDIKDVLINSLDQWGNFQDEYIS